ncbi:hypothetical protein BT96DRAFT_1000784 [Gymnopus androsaceus JB14]|uniref:Uncharacterized protein n=1 Tax=Gymnopus androsaceus JB14 TaxID=1447944 RepID=A0A6A4H3P8_9AGAR|nr:hypothetical protein BT96DRAFT_1000784 [Gymnopus androsaceus JB14]
MDSLDGYGSGDDENMEDAIFHREISSLIDRCSTFVSDSGIDETHTSSSHNGMSNLIFNSNASLPGPTSNALLPSPTSNSPLSRPSASFRSMSAPIDSPIEPSFIFYNTLHQKRHHLVPILGLPLQAETITLGSVISATQ